MKNFWSILALVLTIIGGLNWLIVGIFRFNVVDWVFGFAPWIASIIYILVGLAAIYMICWLAIDGATSNTKTHKQMV